MDLKEFIRQVFIDADNGYKLSEEHTFLNDLYFKSNYVYSVISAKAEYSEEGIDVYINVKDGGSDEVLTILESYSLNGTLEDSYML